MKEIIEPKINITPITPENRTSLANNMFIAGNASNKLSTLSSCARCAESVKIVEQTEAVEDACLDECNCLIPFCTHLAYRRALASYQPIYRTEKYIIIAMSIPLLTRCLAFSAFRRLQVVLI